MFEETDKTHDKIKDYCLLLGADATWRERSILGAARASDSPIAIMQNTGIVNKNRFADIIITGNPGEAELALDAVKKFEEQSGAKPVSVIPLIEMSLAPGLKISQYYNLNYLPEFSVTAARDKSIMKQRFLDAGLPTPQFETFSNFDELVSQKQKFNYPVVLKPSHFGGSEGVCLARNDEELLSAYNHTKNSMLNHARNFGLKENHFQVEEYINSTTEISVEVLNTKYGRTILMVTDKFVTNEPYFSEIGHTVPGKYFNSSRIRSLALEACEAINLDCGVAHVEIKISDNEEPYLLEVNARIPGDGIADLIEKVTGYNIFELHAKSIINDDFQFATKCLEPKGKASIAFLYAKEGRIKKIATEVLATLPPSITAIDITAREGDLSTKNINSHAREGSIEFYWTNDKEDDWYHIDIATDISNQLFQVK
ncbi:MAG: ATP-grasp domain-containing protein [Endozoicomonas sp.]|uniref:ATP-grasp domain-containing protein n=1 Tax=Endozoicomonas sp. TaxID=1892382 RepID=UPI003D9B3EEE